MGHNRVVHVIDDEADVCEALKVLLHTAGMEARTYASAEEFLSEVRLSRPLCLLADVRLPGMSGLDLVRHLQQGPMCAVVVLITGHGDVPLAVKAMRAGALHFLEKPFEPAELLQNSGGSSPARRRNRRRRSNACGYRDQLPVAHGPRTGGDGASG